MTAPAATKELIWREQDGKSVKVPKYFELPKKATTKTYTMAEIQKHNKRGDCWIVVEGKVYDVSNYLPSHPGGSSPILAMGGRDCTDAFGNYHPARVYEHMLPYYYIGTASDYSESDFVKGHRNIRQKLLEQGLFETNDSYYWMKYGCLAAIFLTGVLATILGDSTLMRMFGAVMIAFFWQQTAFVGHDVGHNAITHDRKRDCKSGIIIGNIMQGISMAWWKHTHNVHHVACNSVEIDPDIHHMPFLAVCIDIFDWFRKTLKPTPMGDSFARLMVSYQHVLFYPIMFLVGRYNLYIQSWVLLLTWPEKILYRKYEIAGLIGFLAWYCALLAIVPTNAERVAYLMLSHGVAGILHIQIVLSHFAMPTYRGQAYNGEDDEWFRMQLMTSLNIKTPRLFDWVHGGLQFQIEHHLWPRLPRHHLRYAATLVKKYAEENNVPYNILGFFDANVDLLKSMKSVAMQARKLPPHEQPAFFDSFLWEGMNARG